MAIATVLLASWPRFLVSGRVFDSYGTGLGRYFPAHTIFCATMSGSGESTCVLDEPDLWRIDFRSQSSGDAVRMLVLKRKVLFKLFVGGLSPQFTDLYPSGEDAVKVLNSLWAKHWFFSLSPSCGPRIYSAMKAIQQRAKSLKGDFCSGFPFLGVFVVFISEKNIALSLTNQAPSAQSTSTRISISS